MKFAVHVYYNRKRFLVQAEKIYENNQVEHFRISAGFRSILVQSNRPLLKARGLKHWKPKWKVIEGVVRPGGGFDATMEALDHLVRKQTLL